MNIIYSCPAGSSTYDILVDGITVGWIAPRNGRTSWDVQIVDVPGETHPDLFQAMDAATALLGAM